MNHNLMPTKVVMKYMSAYAVAIVLGMSGAVAAESAAKITLPDNWEAFDKNDDYYASKKEVKAVAPNLNFDAADNNDDGSLSRTEFFEVKNLVASGKWDNEPAKYANIVPADIEGSTKNPVKVVKNNPKGTLENPFDPSNPKMAKAGHKMFLSAGCSGCHGGSGGGGMGPALTNNVWVYGNDPDTLFRLITLGSRKLHEAGYTRQNEEGVVGPMPQQGGVSVKKEKNLWLIITWIKSLHQQ